MVDIESIDPKERKYYRQCARCGSWYDTRDEQQVKSHGSATCTREALPDTPDQELSQELNAGTEDPGLTASGPSY
jgi:hypothetical protein